jgi:hypothetical protein
MAVSLCLLLLSCSATRSSIPSPLSVQELSRLVLVIKARPDGQVIHSWAPLSSFDLSTYPCMEMCMPSLRGRNWNHANRGAKARICRDRCRPAYEDCSQRREQAEALKFQVVDDAVSWLKQHHEELLVGTVVVIAGVTFVVIVAGSGGAALVLAPAVILVGTDVPSEPQIAAVKP